ncbi:MAG: branched-chain amino acid transporter permease [Solirubrobacterales bacterium]|jgi:branched-chain amino acid transport system permease protein|nr:branched-chain amino acid transporter permease [Solirubrobacterales bacterium]
MNDLRARMPAWSGKVIGVGALALAVVFPFFFQVADSWMNTAVIAMAYMVMALGLNTVVGFAGLLDLGYVAFFALGAYTAGWFSSGFYANADIHVGVSGFLSKLPGVHFNWLIVVVIAAVICAVAGVIIGLPTLRLRGDYIAIVTLAFGEIVRVIAINGDELHLPFSGSNYPLTAGRQGITPVDQLQLPGLDPFNQLNLRPWYWTALGMMLIILFVTWRLRDSRLGRAWVAIREDEVAAASMGVPLVKTKLLAYAAGAAMGGMSGAFLGAYFNTVNADQFQFGFSILILAMVILGGLGSIWGAMAGAAALTVIQYQVIQADAFKDIPGDLGFDFSLPDIQYLLYGFLLVLMMILRPQGLIPERRRKLELTEGVGVDDAQLGTHGV